MPEAITYTDARKNLAATMDAVCDSHEPMIITRRKAQAVVMLSLADYNSIAESAYLLKSPANAERLRASIRADEAGQRARHDLTED